MALFTIADLHLSLSADKPMDVFPGWENYVSRIEKNWKNIVSDDDTVVICGDVSWEMKIENTLADFTFIDRLPGKKIIVKGNHDLWWTTMNKMNRCLSDFGVTTISFLNNSAFRVGDKTVCGTRGWLIEESGTDSKMINREALRLRASLEAGRQLGGEPVVFLHYPPVTAQNVCTELVDVLNEFGVRRVYYGHIHGKTWLSAVNGEKDGINYRLVSCDSVGFSPLLVK